MWHNYNIHEATQVRLQGAFCIAPMLKICQGLQKFTPSRQQSYAIFGFILASVCQHLVYCTPVCCKILKLTLKIFGVTQTECTLDETGTGWLHMCPISQRMNSKYTSTRLALICKIEGNTKFKAIKINFNLGLKESFL